MVFESADPDYAAAMVVSFLEARGATFRINRRGFLRADLESCTDFGKVKPQEWITIILSLGEPIKKILHSRKTIH